MLDDRAFVKAKIDLFGNPSVPAEASPGQQANLSAYRKYLDSLDYSCKFNEYKRITVIYFDFKIAEKELIIESKREIPTVLTIDNIDSAIAEIPKKVESMLAMQKEEAKNNQNPFDVDMSWSIPPFPHEEPPPAEQAPDMKPKITIAELATELNITKTAIRKYLTDDFRLQFAETISGVIHLSEEGANLIKSKIRKKAETKD